MRIKMTITTNGADPSGNEVCFEKGNTYDVVERLAAIFISEGVAKAFDEAAPSPTPEPVADEPAPDEPAIEQSPAEEPAAPVAPKRKAKKRKAPKRRRQRKAK